MLHYLPFELDFRFQFLIFGISAVFVHGSIDEVLGVMDFSSFELDFRFLWHYFIYFDVV